MKLALSGLLVTLGDIALADQDLDSADDWYGQGIRASSRLAAPGSIAHALRHHAALEPPTDKTTHR
jgi:hypothetical protein